MLNPPSQVLKRWADLCTTDFARMDPATSLAVLPVAATEQHGPHLPLSVDTDIIEAILGAAAAHTPAELPAYILPTQAVGYSPEHQRFPGTLNLRPETVIALWTDIGASVAQAGVRKLVFFNGHGGHTSVMDIVARELRSRFDLIVYSVSWFNLPLIDPQGQDLNRLIDPSEHRFGIHAGQVETAIMLASKPSLVRPEFAQHFASTAQTRAQNYALLGNGKTAKLGWQTQDYNPQGAVGNASLATPELGTVLVQAAGRSLAALLLEISQLPLSTLVDRPGV